MFYRETADLSRGDVGCMPRGLMVGFGGSLDSLRREYGISKMKVDGPGVQFASLVSSKAVYGKPFTDRQLSDLASASLRHLWLTVNRLLHVCESPDPDDPDVVRTVLTIKEGPDAEEAKEAIVWLTKKQGTGDGPLLDDPRGSYADEDDDARFLTRHLLVRVLDPNLTDAEDIRFLPRHCRNWQKVRRLRLGREVITTGDRSDLSFVREAWNDLNLVCKTHRGSLAALRALALRSPKRASGVRTSGGEQYFAKLTLPSGLSVSLPLGGGGARATRRPAAASLEPSCGAAARS